MGRDPARGKSDPIQKKKKLVEMSLNRQKNGKKEAVRMAL